MKIIEYKQEQDEYFGKKIFNGSSSWWEGLGWHGETLYGSKSQMPNIPKGYKRHGYSHETNSNNGEECFLFYPAKYMSVFGYRDRVYIVNTLLTKKEKEDLTDLFGSNYNQCKPPRTNIKFTKNIIRIINTLRGENPHLYYCDKESGSYGQTYRPEIDYLISLFEDANIPVIVEAYKYGDTSKYTKSIFGKNVTFKQMIDYLPKNKNYNSGFMHELRSAIYAIYDGTPTYNKVEVEAIKKILFKKGV